MTAYIFDVDGVITDPSLKRIKHKEILLKIAELLENEIVTLNTGRSLEWLLERVINPLLEIVKNKENLQNFYAVGEKGGTWLTIDKNEHINQFRDKKITIPMTLQVKVKSLVESEFSETTFYDDTKQTMISTEMIDGLDPEHKYKSTQERLVTRLKELLEEEGIEGDLKIDPTTIATDIENTIVGKDFAVRRIINWLETKNITPDKIIAFGDSKSDIPMAEEIYKKGLPLEFVFVGKELLKDNYPFKINYTQEKYDKGTLEYLNQE
jgi:HAD superfamily hydrolase (TIGR01484 family)